MKEKEPIDEYLDKVKFYLEPLSDADQIISELRTHIFDLANQISVENPGLSIQSAFEHAIMRMEDPKKLASKFLAEEPDSAIDEWKAPIKTPEAKIRNEQFIIIALVGFGLVMVFSWIIQIISNDPLVVGLSVAMGFVGIGMFIVTLYLNDEKVFKEQINRLRELFLRPSSEYREISQKTGQPVFIAAEKRVTKEPSFWSAFGEHLGGAIGGTFIVILIAFIFWLDLAQPVPLFNENWDFMKFTVYSALIFSLINAIFKVIFGKVRFSRLMSATDNILSGVVGVFLTLFYPFTFALAIESQMSSIIEDPELIALIPYADNFALIIISFIAIIHFISALYDVFKFGAWKPSDRRSLL